MPPPELTEAMGTFNEKQVNAGVRRPRDELKPTSHGKRAAFDGDTRTVIDGLFSVTTELVAGLLVLGGRRSERGGRMGQALS